MFEIKDMGNGRIGLFGRFDASQVETVRAVLDTVDGSAILDFARLDYISSAGLGLLLGTQKRLAGSSNGLKIMNMNQHIREIFKIAGFDQIFEVE